MKSINLALLIVLPLLLGFPAKFSRAATETYASQISPKTVVTQSSEAREQELDLAISKIHYAFYRQTGEGIQPTQNNLTLIREMIGATPNETEFIDQRITFYNRVVNQLNRVDAQMERWQSN